MTMWFFFKYISLCVTQGPTGAQGAPGDAGDPGPMVRLMPLRHDKYSDNYW